MLERERLVNVVYGAVNYCSPVSKKLKKCEVVDVVGAPD